MELSSTMENLFDPQSAATQQPTGNHIYTGRKSIRNIFQNALHSIETSFQRAFGDGPRDQNDTWKNKPTVGCMDGCEGSQQPQPTSARDNRHLELMMCMDRATTSQT
ncbi:hypothetical protein TNCV_5019561 [Trichonephila clavipes]|nr:hypothetical protein TNCV_5019561 [Trichonephila clavipes]